MEFPLADPETLSIEAAILSATVTGVAVAATGNPEGVEVVALDRTVTLTVLLPASSFSLLPSANVRTTTLESVLESCAPITLRTSLDPFLTSKSEALTLFARRAEPKVTSTLLVAVALAPLAAKSTAD
ncbi:hypothetical protein D3C71_1256910 [compost metagenome]